MRRVGIFTIRFHSFQTMTRNIEVMRVCTTDAKHNIRQIQNSIRKYTVLVTKLKRLAKDSDEKDTDEIIEITLCLDYIQKKSRET